jgi:YD repeat-containing protein
VVRYFHDEAGRQVGVLDAEGYLTETQYDQAGRVLSLTRYASASPAAYRATGTLAQLRPGTTGQDQTTRYFHDGRGQLVGVLDAQGYLTEYVIDETWSVRAERRYATAVVSTAGDTLSSLRAQAGTYQQVRKLYDGQGRLSIESNAEGTQTRYTYDAAGRLVKTETAHGTSEVREGHRRYNAFGELIGEISGEGALQLLPGMSEAQLDAIYAQYGVRHSYDVLGRRIESIDAAGNKTWYFHDSAGRLTFTVKGVADEVGLQNARGEVTETRYTAFGDVADTIAYTGRLTIPVPGSRASAANAISTLAYAAAICLYRARPAGPGHRCRERDDHLRVHRLRRPQSCRCRQWHGIGLDHRPCP